MDTALGRRLQLFVGGRLDALLAPEDALGKAALAAIEPSPKQGLRRKLPVGATSPSQLAGENELRSGEVDRATEGGSSWTSPKLQFAFGQWGADDFS